MPTFDWNRISLTSINKCYIKDVVYFCVIELNHRLVIPYNIEIMFVQTLIENNLSETLQICLPYLKYQDDFVDHMLFAKHCNSKNCFRIFISWFSMAINTGTCPTHINIKLNDFFYNLLINRNFNFAEEIVPILHIQTLHVDKILIYDRVFNKIVLNKHLCIEQNYKNSDSAAKGWNAFVDFLIYNFSRPMNIQKKFRYVLFKTLFEMIQIFIKVNYKYRNTIIYYILQGLFDSESTHSFKEVIWNCEGTIFFSMVFCILKEVNINVLSHIIIDLSQDSTFNTLIEIIHSWLYTKNHFNNPIVKNNFSFFMRQICKNMKERTECKFLNEFLHMNIDFINKTFSYVMPLCYTNLIYIVLFEKKIIPLLSLIVFIKYLNECTCVPDIVINVIIIRICWSIDLNDKYTETTILDLYKNFPQFFNIIDYTTNLNIYNNWLDNKEMIPIIFKKRYIDIIQNLKHYII